MDHLILPYVGMLAVLVIGFVGIMVDAWWTNRKSKRNG